MEILRWILLAVGLLLIAYLYFRGRHEASRPDEVTEARPREVGEPTISLGDVGAALDRVDRVEPGLDDALGPQRSVTIDEPEPPRSDLDPAAQESSSPEPESAAPSARQKIVSLKLVARDQGRLEGAAVLAALREAGLQFGDYKIFHRYPVVGVRAPSSATSKSTR